MSNNERESTRELLRPVVFAALNLGAAFLFPAIAKRFFDKHPLTDGENLLFGILVFCAFTLVEILFTLVMADARQRREGILLLAESKFELLLLAMRESLRSITSRLGPQSAFSQYFLRELERIESDLRSVAASGELPVTEQHLYLSDSVLSAFNGSRTSELCIVHRLSNNAQILSTHELEWVRKVHAFVLSKRIRKVRRLFIYETDAELKHNSSLDLFAVHESERAYDFRVIPATEFSRLQHDLGIAAPIVDFGLYSDAYLYKLLRYDGVNGGFSGSYTASQPEIQRFREWFESSWNCPRSWKPMVDKKLSMNELLAHGGVLSLETPIGSTGGAAT